MAITKRTIKRRDGTTYNVWRARVPDPTKPASASAKLEATFATKREAIKWETAKRNAVHTGTYISTGDGSTQLKVVADAWRETWDAKPLSPKTQQGYASILSNHVLPRWGDVKVSAIDAKAVQQWINAINAKQHAETTHHCYTVLRQVLKLAVAHKLIASNACTPDSITLPSKKAAAALKAKPLALTKRELRQLVNAMPEHYRLATTVAGLCGLRAGELWGLTRGDIAEVEHEDDGTLTTQLTVRFAIKDIGGKLMAGPTKTHQTRSLTVPESIVPLLTAAAKALGVKVRNVRSKTNTKRTSPVGGYPAIKDAVLDWTDDAQDPDRLLFTTPGGAAVQHTNFYERIYRPTVVKLWPEPHRLNGFRFHDLRHTAASLAIAATGNLGVVQKRLGHSSITTTYDRYHHLMPDADKSLADTLGDMWDATEDELVRIVAGYEPDELSNVIPIKAAS